MDEKFLIDMFNHFSEDLHPSLRQKMIDMDYNGYYAVIVSNSWAPRRPMLYDKEQIKNYSLKELYEQMCDFFYQLDEGEKGALYNIFRLKNFINYKMQKMGV